MAGGFQNPGFQVPGFQNSNAAPPIVTPPRRHGGKHLPRGAAEVTGPAGQRLRRVVMTATFTAPHPRWRAVLDYDDDDLAIAFLLES